MLRFFLPPRQDITSLTYPDGFCEEQAVWLCETRQDGLSAPSPCCEKSFRLVPCLENIIVHEKVAFDAARFRLFFPERKAFNDIHRNVGLVRSVMIRQRRSSNCNKPVITWPLGRLANLSPSGASCPRVIN